MKSSVLILLAIVAIILAGCAFAFTFMHDIADVADGGNEGTFNKVADKVDQVTSSDSSNSYSDSGSSSSSSSVSSSNDGDSAGDILSDVIKQNDQNGEGEYREVTYKDGGFRQYDKETGDLIGSSYDEDQEKLGVVDGNLE